MSHRRRKNIRIAELPSYPNVSFLVREQKEFIVPFFAAHTPLILELGCGKGKYTVALAEQNREKNFIGVDVKGERLWVGAKESQEKHLSNVAFVRGRVQYFLQFLSPKSVSEIWITFPDPFPRDKQAKHRLTSPIFLEMYKKILVSKGKVHLKTDDKNLFDYSLETFIEAGGKIVEKVEDIYGSGQMSPVLNIQTDFEKKHLTQGKKIYYVCVEFYTG